MLEEADLAMTQNAMGAGQSNARFAQDDGLFVTFHLHPVLNDAKSKEQGRPIYEDKEYITIIIPGDKDNVVDRKVMEQDKMRFPRQYQQFKSYQENPQEGTPLSEWPGIARSQIEELKFFHVHTVEQLAAIPDSQSQKFMGINVLKQKAKAYLQDTSMSAPFTQLQEENEVLTQQIHMMQSQIEELREMLKAESSDGSVQDTKSDS